MSLFITGAVDATTRTQIDGALSTGLISGGEITINADPTRFDHARVKGRIVDSTDPDNIVVHEIDIPAATGILATGLASTATTFLSFVAGSDVPVQSADFPADDKLRLNLQVGALVHPDNATITGISDFTSAPFINQAPSMTDITQALGTMNILGNEMEGDPAGNLSFKKLIGKMFFLGIQAKSVPLNPNNIATPELVTPDIIFTWRASGGATWLTSDPVDVITAGVYDDNTGGVGAPSGTVTTNNWINCLISYSPDANQLVIHYGQVTYNSDTSALAFLSADTHTMARNPAFSGVPVIGALSIRGAALNLTLAGDAVFTEANRFGDL